MAIRSVIILTIITNTCHKIDSFLSGIPRDIEVKVNDSTYLNCSTSLLANKVQWRHGKNYIYTGLAILEPYNDRFSVEIDASTGACNLVIRSAQPSDAGTYECAEDEGFGEQKTAHLIVLDDDPVCRSNMHPNGVIGPNSCGIEPDEVKLSCSIKYHGNSLPVLQWEANGDNQSIADGMFNITSNNNELTNTLTMKSTLGLKNSSFTCQTTRTSDFDKKYSCSSVVINILYIFSSEIAVNITMNDEVNCLANTSQSCNYKWKWFKGDDSSTESDYQILKPKKIGMHRCEATCSIRNKSCSVQSKHATVDLEKDTSGPSRMALLVLLLVPVLGVFGVIVYCWRKRRMERRRHDEIRLRQAVEEQQRLLDDTKRRLEEIKRLRQVEEKERLRREEEERQRFDAETRRLENIELHRREEEERQKLLGLVATIRTKAAEERQKLVRGLTILDNELFVASTKCSEVEVYDSIKFSFSRQWTLKQLIHPLDMVSCHRNKCLYISNEKVVGLPSEIFRVDPTGKLIKKWSEKIDRGRLSVTYDSNVILTAHKENNLNEYLPDGQLIRQIHLSSEEGFCHLWHAIKLTNGHFVVSHGIDNDDDMHRVCIVDADGMLLKSFGEKRGSTIRQTHSPLYLSVNGSGSVIVADFNNGRILSLDSKLEFENEILTKEHGLQYPMRIVLDDSNGQLFVSDNEKNNYRILIFDLGLVKQTRNATLNS